MRYAMPRTSSKAIGRRVFLAAALSAAAAFTPPAHAQEVEVRAVTPWPRNYVLSRSFQSFVDMANEAGKGVVRINYVGGPEALPATEQPAALRRGVIDMYYGAASYFLGDLPEVDALAGGTRTPEQLRANGGYDLLDGIMQKKVNVKFVSNPDTGWAFVLYLSREPKQSESKPLDLAGMKLRSVALYRDFLSSLGADHLTISLGEMFTAFERNMVQGLASPEVGIMDLGIEKFIKYRVSPNFFQSDIVLLMNHNKWNALPEKAKQIISSVALKHEEASRKHFLQEVARERAALDKLGIKEIKLSGKAAEEYLALARAVPWNRISKSGSSNLAPLKEKFLGQ